MKKIYRAWVGLLLFSLLASACTQEETLPTLIPTAVPPTEEMPPTAESAVESVPTATATQRVRPTFPPTFTPTPAPTDTPTATQVFPSPTLFIQYATPNPACNTFDTIFEQSDYEFAVGVSPRATWRAVEGAQLYRLILKESNGRVINDQIYLAETTYTFPADLFEVGRSYGWEVYPINAQGDQMCFAVGLEMFPQRQLFPNQPLGSGG